MFLMLFPAKFAGEKCDPGETKLVECNECRCLPDGSDFACTKKKCPPSLVRQKRQGKYQYLCEC